MDETWIDLLTFKHFHPEANYGTLRCWASRRGWESRRTFDGRHTYRWTDVKAALAAHLERQERRSA